jgi:N-acetylneuraminic acid mutarotase
MVIWGGANASAFLNDGGVYDPQTDSWQAVYLVNVPGSVYSGLGFGMSGRAVFVGGLAGAGGYNKSALTYDPATGGWTSMGGSPGMAGLNTTVGAVSTGNAVIWCGSSAGGVTQNLGWVFNAFGTAGYQMSAPVSGGGAGCNRNDHTAVWTGTKLLVYGGLVNTGFGNVLQSDGNSYDLSTDAWTAFAGEGFPRYPNRWDAAAVWTGTRMIVWGGGTGATLVSGAAGLTQSGGAYDPVSNTWTTLSEINAPSLRMSPAAYWTGTKMVVWGGFDYVTGSPNTGAVYMPSTDAWTTMSLPPWANARANLTTVWTGSSMIVWGGASGSGGPYPTDGAIYHP